MAFGALLDTGFTSLTSITNPTDVTSGGGLSVSVAVGDLVIGVFGEQTDLTVTGVTDNLGNTYTASNAGTDAGSSTGRMFYSFVTVAGTLNTVHFACTADVLDAIAAVAVFAGPFASTSLDANPANSTADLTSPHSCPVTGTLAQAIELVVSWGCSSATSVDGVGTGTLAIAAGGAGNQRCAIVYTVTAATTSVAHTITSTTNPSAIVLGTSSFKQIIAGQPTVKRFGGVPFANSLGRGRW